MFGLVIVCWLLLSLHPAFSSIWLFVWMPWSLIFELRSAVHKPDSLSYKMIDGNTAKPPISEQWGQALER